MSPVSGSARRRTAVKTSFFALSGGLNETTPPINLKPGECIAASNYEAALPHGYRRVDGYERLDGHPAPSAATYWLLSFTGGSTEPAVGDLITGGTSGATGELLTAAVVSAGSWATNDAAGYYVISNKTGVFVAAEVLTPGVAAVALAGDATIGSASTDALNTAYLQAAIEAARAKIQAVPGSGSVLGVWQYNGVKYAFRNNAGGTAALMYKSTSAGWVGVGTPTALSPGGRYEFVNYNFAGSSSQYRMYFVNGLDKAKMFDGTTVTDITTGMPVETPTHIVAYKYHLFLSFPGGSLQFSALGDPTSWTPITGAGELGVGSEIVGIQVELSDILGVYTEEDLYHLNGTSSADFSLKRFHRDIGAKAGSIQKLAYSLLLNRRGLIMLAPRFYSGNFRQQLLSRKINDTLVAKVQNVQCSVISSTKNQYRLFFNDGTAYFITFDGEALTGIMPVNYGITVNTTVAVNEQGLDEILLCGAADGYVYQLDKGTSFDGVEIEAYLVLPYYHYGTPSQKKKFRGLEFELAAPTTAAINVLPDFSYGDIRIPAAVEDGFTAQGLGGKWGLANWKAFVWDGQAVSTGRVRINGVGTNMSLTLHSTSIYDTPYTLQGIITSYSVRKLMR